MARLTRAESQARTREHVLDTAYELFLRDGYSVTSMERVADAAGYSKGAVYSNFATKNDLCLAVIDRVRLEQAARLIAEVGDSPDIESRIAGFTRWAERTIGDGAWTSLEVEFGIAGRHDPRIRAEIAARRRAVTATLAEVLQSEADAAGTALSRPPESAVTALIGLGVGLGVLRAVDPDVSIEPLIELLRQIMGGR